MAESPSREQDDTLRSTEAWQRRLLPLMSRMLIALAVFFFVATCVQLYFIEREVKNGPTLPREASWQLLQADGAAVRSEPLRAAELRALVALEWASMDNHAHQARVFLMTRTWLNYLGFVTGMILALMGAVFVPRVKWSASPLPTRRRRDLFPERLRYPGRE